MSGPRATGALLLASGILFAVLLVALGWRAGAQHSAVWMVPVASIVAAAIIAAAVIFSKGAGEGRL